MVALSGLGDTTSWASPPEHGFLSWNKVSQEHQGGPGCPGVLEMGKRTSRSSWFFFSADVGVPLGPGGMWGRPAAASKALMMTELVQSQSSGPGTLGWPSACVQWLGG